MYVYSTIHIMLLDTVRYEIPAEDWRYLVWGGTHTFGECTVRGTWLWFAQHAIRARVPLDVDTLQFWVPETLNEKIYQLDVSVDEPLPNVNSFYDDPCCIRTDTLDDARIEVDIDYRRAQPPSIDRVHHLTPMISDGAAFKKHALYDPRGQNYDTMTSIIETLSTGYNYDRGDEPTYLECLVEKLHDDDVLLLNPHDYVFALKAEYYTEIKQELATVQKIVDKHNVVQEWI